MTAPHRLEDTFPAPAGWRARCRCGATVRGYDEADAMAQYLYHCEQVHLQDVEPEDGTE